MGSLGVIAALLLVACTTTPAGDDTQTEPQPGYRDVVELFDQGVARTCALNGGVCHNSNNYPDLHTVSNVIAAVGRECNVETKVPADIHDACEPPADHLVIPSAAIDARIVSAVPAADLATIALVLDPAPAMLAMPSDTEVHRGTTVFKVSARVTSVSGARVTLGLQTAEAKRFFDVRTYPVGPLQLHVGDPNGNGVQGALVEAMPLITAGDPERSYLLRRLIDSEYGELMPRQCRTWNDRANRTLACWIAGLASDASNAYEPIDYAACNVAVEGRGRCGD